MADADPPRPAAHAVRTIANAAVDAIALAELIAQGQPVILKGAARDWPLVRAGLDSPEAAAAMLRAADAGHPVVGYVGDPAIRGRFHYTPDATGMNFTTERAPLGSFLDRILATQGDPAAPSIYLGSTDLGTYFPELRAANDIVPSDGSFDRHPPTASIWIGNRTTAATHWDMSDNMAVCVAGRRRFTLFPPDQVGNLYPGPIDPTPAGQVVSMVDLAAPDLDRYPRFAAALACAMVADLEPGDVLVYPALWWHHVEALSAFNILVNYWWNAAPDYLDTPMTTLLHGMLSLRDRPDHEKQAWRSLFDHYLFAPADQARAHLPKAAQGPLAPLDAVMARRLRALIANRINR
ncbi:cupin-like domain-containing protein [Sphingomonas sp. OK281]|uniref:cupin-like domain-containing protein n=1 Tax=Sphingomonas sp. OK281 TaxID=1881067 RepID=UPI0008E47813|nr:cupin-like domain-containing protein [Sphingomonas sp. OK281]SFN70300.1 Cupin-like domain-containing protein [Sphingomonas sp. OK281]